MMVGKPVGVVVYREKFNGKASSHNTTMYDKLKVEYTKIYCAGCGKPLGNYKTNECSARVKQALGLRKLI